MTTTQIVIIVAVLAAAAAVVVPLLRRRSLQKTFGPEYDRTVAEKDSRSAAERELRDRERRHAELQLTELSASERAKYQAAWEEVQIRFVDSPREAVSTADQLVTRLIAARGYPTEGYEGQLAHLSVQHATTLGHYRDAHEISERNSAGKADTEDLRQALVHYRALFADLLGAEPVGARYDGDRADATDARATRREAGRHHVNGNRPDTAD